MHPQICNPCDVCAVTPGWTQWTGPLSANSWLQEPSSGKKIKWHLRLHLLPVLLTRMLCEWHSQWSFHTQRFLLFWKMLSVLQVLFLLYDTHLGRFLVYVLCVCIFIMNAPRAHLRGRQELRSTTCSLYCNHHTHIIGSVKVSWYGNVWHTHLHN